MNQDQARRMAEEVELPEPVNKAAAGKGTWGMASYGPLYTASQVREAIAAALVKLTQQEPVAWRPQYNFPNWPDYVNWNTGVPTQSDVDYWDAQKIEIQYAYTHSIPSQQEERVRELEKALEVARVEPLTQRQREDIHEDMIDTYGFVGEDTMRMVNLVIDATENSHGIGKDQAS